MAVIAAGIYWLMENGAARRYPGLPGRHRQGGLGDYLEKGLGSKFLAGAFALFGIGVALFGIGTFPQVNAIADAAQLTFLMYPNGQLA